jgi:hypothetical protein
LFHKLDIDNERSLHYSSSLKNRRKIFCSCCASGSIRRRVEASRRLGHGAGHFSHTFWIPQRQCCLALFRPNCHKCHSTFHVCSKWAQRLLRMGQRINHGISTLHLGVDIQLVKHPCHPYLRGKFIFSIFRR